MLSILMICSSRAEQNVLVFLLCMSTICLQNHSDLKNLWLAFKKKKLSKIGKTQAWRSQDLHEIVLYVFLGLPCLYSSLISPLVWDFTERRTICWICCCMTLTTMGPSPMTGTSTCFGKAWWKVHFMRLAWEQKFKDFVRLPTLPPGKPGTPFSPFSPTPPKPWGKTSTLNLWSVCNLTAQP